MVFGLILSSICGYFLTAYKSAILNNPNENAINWQSSNFQNKQIANIDSIKLVEDEGTEMFLLQPYYTGKYWEGERIVNGKKATLSLMEGWINDFKGQERLITFLAGIRDSSGKNRKIICFDKDRLPVTSSRLTERLKVGDQVNIFTVQGNMSNEGNIVEYFDLGELNDFNNLLIEDLGNRKKEIIENGYLVDTFNGGKMALGKPAELRGF